jgi:uncharacterized protein YndB with AHSA1/START domain
VRVPSITAMRSRHVSVVVHRPPSEVYEFAVEPDNLARWAAGLASSEVTREGDTLVVTGPMGEVRVVFAERNPYGVLDHDVTTPDGTTTNNPVRVVSHPEGAEVVFSVRQLALTDDELERDAALVQADLERLRDLLEE